MAGTGYRIDVHLRPDGATAAMAAEVRKGLTGPRKELPSKYFYDERGSRLFEKITELPEYYLTRSEQRILERHAGDIAQRARPTELVELGSGSAKKTRLLIEAARANGDLQRYIPVEVSQGMAERSARDLVDAYPNLDVHAIIADFEQQLHRVPQSQRPLVALLGSTIGNFPRGPAVKLLRDVALLLGNEGYLLLGADLVKPTVDLEAAYNDSQGVTAAFNRNILNVVNNYLQADFEPDAFEHVAYFNENETRIETYLESRRAHSVRVEALDMEVSFEEGERMRTEVSCKYTRQSVTDLLHQAGLKVTDWFTDDDETFALSLSRRSG